MPYVSEWHFATEETGTRKLVSRGTGTGICERVLILIAVVVAMTIVVDLFGGVIFDFDVSTVYRNVFRKLDEMVAEMEELGLILIAGVVGPRLL
jgi:hypothetical protein